MTAKDLTDKAINIKGKQYIQVSDRVLFFNEQYPNGAITTELVSDYDSQTIVIKATATPDIDKPLRKFTGYAQEVIGQGMINKTSAMENAETSAVGRALGMMGIGVIESIASADEVNKAQNRGYSAPKKTTQNFEYVSPDGKYGFKKVKTKAGEMKYMCVEVSSDIVKKWFNHPGEYEAAIDKVKSNS